jgi:hypothetical protein
LLLLLLLLWMQETPLLINLAVLLCGQQLEVELVKQK